jgi:hypothetical protein
LLGNDRAEAFNHSGRADLQIENRGFEIRETEL